MKKEFVLFGGIAAIVLLAICLCALFVGRENNETTGPALSETKTVQQVMDQMENSLDLLLGVPNVETADEPEFLIEVDERNGYEILSFEETETGAIATVKVYAPDLYSIAKNIDENNTFETEEEVLNAINEALKDAELVERQISLEFLQTEDGYSPILTSEFLDALYGGVFRLYDDLLDAE